MPESWHPRKTEKDVAVARAGVAKYDRGWKYGGSSYVQEHDHSKPGKGGEVLNPEQIRNTIDVTTYSGGDLGVQFNNAIAEHGKQNVRYVVGTDSGTISTAVDLTDAQNVVVDLRGANIDINNPGGIGFDTCGMWRSEFYVGELTSTDSLCAILHAGATYNGDHFKVKGDTIAGAFDYAPIIHLGGECVDYNCRLVNTASQGYTLIVSISNDFMISGASTSISSPYVTLDNRSSRHIHVGSTLLASVNNVGDGVVSLDNSAWVSVFENIDFRSVGEPFIVLDNRNNGVQQYSFLDCTFRVWDDVSVDATAETFKTLSGVNECERIQVRDCHIDHSPLGSTATDYFINNNGGCDLKEWTITPVDVDDDDGILLNGGTWSGNSRVENIDFADRVSTGADTELDLKNCTCKKGMLAQGTIVGHGNVVLDGGTTNDGLRLGGDGVTVKNVEAKTTPGGGTIRSGFKDGGYSDYHVTGLLVSESDWVGVSFAGSNGYVECKVMTSSVDENDVDINGVTDVVVDGEFESVTHGTNTRGVANGRSLQGATPGSGATGDGWGGNEEQAEALGVVVEDTSVTAPYDLYKVDSGGNWIQIG